MSIKGKHEPDFHTDLRKAYKIYCCEHGGQNGTISGLLINAALQHLPTSTGVFAPPETPDCFRAGKIPRTQSRDTLGKRSRSFGTVVCLTIVVF